MLSQQNNAVAEKLRKDGREVRLFSLNGTYSQVAWIFFFGCMYRKFDSRVCILFPGPRSELPLNPEFVVSTVFVSNFIGIVFARSLHYQFYCWYFHSLPYLLWKGKVFKNRVILNFVVSATVLGCVELCFNVYPATAWSSALLQVQYVHK